MAFCSLFHLSTNERITSSSLLALQFKFNVDLELLFSTFPFLCFILHFRVMPILSSLFFNLQTLIFWWQSCGFHFLPVRQTWSWLKARARHGSGVVDVCTAIRAHTTFPDRSDFVLSTFRVLAGSFGENESCQCWWRGNEAQTFRHSHDVIWLLTTICDAWWCLYVTFDYFYPMFDDVHVTLDDV